MAEAHYHVGGIAAERCSECVEREADLARERKARVACEAASKEARKLFRAKLKSERKARERTEADAEHMRNAEWVANKLWQEALARAEEAERQLRFMVLLDRFKKLYKV